MARIAIIGSGITGVTSAYALARSGHKVTVLDRHLYPAMETSFANGGQLSASNAEVWNSWSTILKGLRWMTQPSAPLLINLRPSWHKYSWLAEFCHQVTNYRANTIETVRLALAAREHLYRIAAEEQIDFDLETRGILHIYHDRSSFEVADRANALLCEAGLERFGVTSEEIRTIEPSLTGQLYGGFFTPSDASGDIHKFARALACACTRRGVDFVHGVNVERVIAEEHGAHLDLGKGEAETSYDAVVVCAGAWSRHLAAGLGDRINIYPVKGYSVTIHLDDAVSQQAAPHVSLLDESAKIVTSRLGLDRFRVAGTAEFNGFNKDIRHDRIAPLTRWAPKPVSANGHRCSRAMGRAATDDAVDASGRPTQQAIACVLQHWPRAFGVDVVGCDGRNLARPSGRSASAVEIANLSLALLHGAGDAFAGQNVPVQRMQAD